MKIAIGSDHAGFQAKEALKAKLKEWGHDVLDVGAHSEASCDYPDFARDAAHAVTRGDAERGVLVCGTGIGMAMAANKVRGARAAVVHDAFTAKMAREHNDANILCAGARVLGGDAIVGLVKVFIETPFGGGRHARRVEKIMRLDGEA